MSGISESFAKEQGVVLFEMLHSIRGPLRLIGGSDVLGQDICILIGHAKQKVAGNVGKQRSVEVLG